MFICDCNIHLFVKLGNRMLQEELNRISLLTFFQNEPMGKSTSAPTNVQLGWFVRTKDYWFKASITSAMRRGAIAASPRWLG